MIRKLSVILCVAVLITGGVYLLLPTGDTARLSEARKALFEQAALRAGPLVGAIAAYSVSAGHPPETLADLVPDYIDSIPMTGVEKCARFDYRLLPIKQALLAWYDLGSRQGQPWSGKMQYSEGNPEHAILIFTLDEEDKITGALIDRAPKDIEAMDFDSARWKQGQGRMEMAPALADTYRLYGMPRAVFEELLGVPDGNRTLHKAPWELRIPCPTRPLNRDALVYWPTEQYPEHLYGGKTEVVGAWVYLHN
jgi:hypothetical protein